MAGGWSMVPVALCLLICLFNDTAPIRQVQGLDEGAKNPAEDLLHHLVDAKEALVNSVVQKLLPTPVSDFSVLAFGGDDQIQAYSSAELYDSVSATWKVTGNMTDARADFAAVKLPNGGVLATGGSTNVAITATCEIYNPVTGLWNSTGSMSTPRALHQLVLLPNGLVLASGGYSSSQPLRVLSSSEIYNSSTGVWTPTGSMNNARGQHSMVLIANGNPISAGGYNGVSELASTEIYMASTGQWSLVAPMSSARVYFNLIPLNSGKILAAGGQNGSFLAIASSELYDPATSQWSTTGSLPIAQEFYASTLLSDGAALVTGGVNVTADLTASTIYKEDAGAWSSTGSLSTARFDFRVAALGSSQVLAVGGRSSLAANSGALASAEIYSIATGLWSPTAAMSVPRTGLQLIAL